MKNLIKFIQIFTIISLMALSAQAQSVTLSASADAGAPGDVITFNWSYSLDGYPFSRQEIKFDGKSLPNLDKIDSSGTFVWTAEPGTHVFRVFLRVVTGYDSTTEKDIRVERQAMTVVQISGWETNEFSHPGLSLSGKEIDIIKKNVFGSEHHPMKDGWNELPGNASYTPHAVDTFDWSADKSNWDDDGLRLYRVALKWAIGGEDKYGDAAVKILNGWGSTCKKMSTNGVYPFLHVTNYIDYWLESAEILKHYNGGYSGWSDADIKQYDEQYVRGVLVPMSLAWWGNVGDPYATQNQPLNVAKARIMLGIYLNDNALFQSGYDHLFNTMHGDHYTQNYWYKDIFGYDSVSLMELSIGPDGEYMEQNRDSNHRGMCVNSIQKSAEVLWHQGHDMYDMILHGEATPRFFQGKQWLLKGMTDGVTLSKSGNTVTLGSRALGSYEQVYNHYKYRQNSKYSFPLLEQYIANKRAGGVDSIADGYAAADVLIHANLSKGVQTPIINKNISTLIPKLSMMINGSKMLMINYRGWDKNAQVKLYNPAGRKIQRASLAQGINTIPLKSLSSGLYIAQFKADGANNIKKFMVR